MLEIGDSILFALTAWKRWSWSAFKSAFDEIRRAQGAAADTERFAGFARWHCASLLDALAHCDFTFSGGAGQLVSAPTVLASLPTVGLPRAVLCGGRSPGTIRTLIDQAEAFGGSVRISSVAQQSIRNYAPARIEVESDDIADMARFAEDLGITFARIPPAWSIAVRAGGLDGYLDALAWSDDPEIGWPREDFDPSSLTFGPAGDSSPRLSRYQDPTRGTWMHRLVREGSSARVDSSWGRWIALRWSSRIVLDYDAARGILRAPASAPLPRLVARALALCSGRVPRLARNAEPDAESYAAAGSSRGTWAEAYEGVPSDVYELVASKIGQFSEDPSARRL